MPPCCYFTASTSPSKTVKAPKPGAEPIADDGSTVAEVQPADDAGETAAPVTKNSIKANPPQGKPASKPGAAAKPAPATPPKVNKPAGAVKAYQNQVLDFINTLRKKHHVGPLGLDRELTKIAQDGAQKSAKDGKLGYTCDGNACAYGENQGQAAPNSDMAEGVKAAVQFWYDDEPNYNYATGKEKPGKEFPGAFTALVWKGSKKIGIGAMVNESDGSIYVVVTFSPAGNVEGQFVANVLKP